MDHSNSPTPPRVKERREIRKGNESSSSIAQDFLDVMLNSGFPDLQIHTLALMQYESMISMFSGIIIAGTETTSTTIEWAMSEILKNKEAMYKIYEELRREIIPTTTLDESHISQLPHLHACVKETLRLHPPGPFLIPHRALDTCKVMNYIIPKSAQVIVNVWVIGRDPIAWKEPLCFKPERFLESNLDFKGQDFEFIPFSAGRRMCSGLPLATKQVDFILATLFHNFDWDISDNMDSSDLDMGEKFGMTLQRKQPLVLVPKKKL